MTTAALSTTPSIPIDPRISAIASGIAAAIPDAQVRLFGSRAKGTSRPDSDVDLLITVPDLPGVNYIGGCVNYVGGFRPLPPPAMAGGGDSKKLSHCRRQDTWPTLPRSSAMEPGSSDRSQASSPLAGALVAVPSERCSGAHEPADPTVRRQRGAHLRHLAPGGGMWLSGN